MKFAIKKATDCLLAGGIIAYPTESVYGLGCDPQNIKAVHRLVSLKNRSINKGLILVAANFDQLLPYLAEIDFITYEKVMNTWPGPTTWLLPCNQNAPKYLRGHFNLQAVRISNHPVVESLCLHFGGAIVSTSANKSGRPATKTALQVRHIFSNNIDYIVNGKLGGINRPSKIINVITNKVVRQ